MNWKTLWRGMVGGLFCVVFLTACVSERSPVTGKKQAYGFSWSQEQQIGKENDAQIVQQFGLYEDERVQAYVNGVGQRVLQQSDLRDADAPKEYKDTQFTFRVLNSPVVNAFALPGGYIYVTRGLLTHVNNEAQLAVVLGHEIAHVAARHSARQAVKAQTSQLGLLAGAILGSTVLKNPQAAEQIMNVGGSALGALLLKYGRDAEREADQLGVKYAASKGYEAAEGAEFFTSLKRIGELEGRALPSWQSTHPDPGEREVTVRQLAKQYERPNDIKKIGRDEYLQQLQGMVIGEDPREGFVDAGKFYHPELKFQFDVPQGWKVNNERAAVIMIDEKRTAMIGLQMVPEKTAAEAAQKFSSAQGLQVGKSGATTVNGLQAHVVEASAKTQQGEVGVINYFIESGGKVYSFMGYTAAQGLSAMAPQFRKALGSFRPVRDSQVLNVQPSRLRIVNADGDRPFREFLPRDLPPGLTPDKLAIVNQVELDERVPRGTLLKLPAGKASSNPARAPRRNRQAP